ncbi:MAG: hypothetical protein ACJA08_003525, partial [Cyclobacteriaceae bacterium]
SYSALFLKSVSLLENVDAEAEMESITPIVSLGVIMY